MNMKYIALFGVMLLFSGVFAISGATVGTQTNLTRWTGDTAGSIVTEGGNISAQNVSLGALTDKWAGLFGNITGSIYLTDDSGGTTNYIYTWVGSDANGGEVCASTNNAFTWATVSNAIAADLDDVWNFGAASDNATNTFTGSTCDLTFAQGSVTNTADTADSQGNNAGDTFQTCVVDDGSSTTKGNFAFCTQINSTGGNFLGDAADYELIVPTSYGTGPSTLETYYFYAEFN